MPAYNFKSKFAPLVECGKKRQTIRKPRKTPTKPGQWLKLYTGMRTKKCRLLGEAICTKVTPIKIHQQFVSLDGRNLAIEELIYLARVDGFTTPVEFLLFFEKTYGLPVEMELIEWMPLRSF